MYRHDGAGYSAVDAPNDEMPDGEYGDGFEQEEAAPELSPVEKLRAFIKSPNIAADLDKEQLNNIGHEVTRGYEIDKASRADWEKQTKTAMDLAMQVAEEKTWPWKGAANVKYPLITTGAIQFSARAYPAIVRGADVVKGQVTGPDPEGKKKYRAERIGRHMSYQLLNQMEEWDEETDMLLLQMAIVGCAFRKTYFDKSMGRNCSDLVQAKHLVYNHAVPWRKLRRKTHELNLYKNEVTERIRGGLFVEIELGCPTGTESDEDGHHEFLEQHCWYDLDEDGYKEPYIVTVLKETSEVARIVARFDEDDIFLNDKREIGKINPVEYFTKYQFMPNPDGGSYDVGLGILLNPINETVNTVLNQLLDAGTQANTGGGFIGSGLRMKGGSLKFAPGEFKTVDSQNGEIAKNIYQMQFQGPSPVLFQLLGMLIEAGKDISSVKDILTGDQNVNQTATTTLALIEQGQKVFSAIYKRVHRSLKAEFQKLFRLNKLYMQPEEYYMFQDKAEPILLEDYQGDSTDVAPVSDPDLISDAQELTRAEALMQFKGDSHINQVELRRRWLRATKEQNIESILIEEQPEAPPDPMVIKAEAEADKIKVQTRALEVTTTAAAEKSVAEMQHLAAKTAEIEASGILKLAQAEAQELGNQMQMYMGQFQSMVQGHMAAIEQFKAMQQPSQQQEQIGNDEQSGVRGVQAPPEDGNVSSIPSGLSGDADGGMGERDIQPPGPGPVGGEEFGGDVQVPGV